jgi:tetratricopeptide (TPR) repeat protein
LSRLVSDDPTEIRTHMRLAAALAGAGSLFQDKRIIPEIAAWPNTLAIAERLGDVEFQLRALWGWWNEKTLSCDFHTALDLGKRFVALSQRSPVASDALIGERMLGVAQHFLGNQDDARRLVGHMLEHYVPDPSHITRFQMDQRVMARGTFPMVLWLQGFPDQAMRMAEANVEEPEDAHAISVTYALSRSTCPIAFLTGDLAAADRFLDILRRRCALHGTANWNKWLRCFEALQLIEGVDPTAGVNKLSDELDVPPTASLRLHYLSLLCDLAEAAWRDGRLEWALQTIDKAIDRARLDGDLWRFPDMLRVKGEIAYTRGAPDEAETHFHESIEPARRQTALSWELRGATSLARLWHAQGRPREALALLAPVYGRFTEGFETRDLRTARRLLDELA